MREFTIASTLQKMLRDVEAVGNDIDWLPMSAAGGSLVIRDVTISGDIITGTFNDNRSFQTYSPTDPNLVDRLYDKGVTIRARPANEGSTDSDRVMSGCARSGTGAAMPLCR